MSTGSYLEFTFEIKPKGDLDVQIGGELLSAQLGTIDFESFVETKTGLLAYVAKDLFIPERLGDVDLLQSSLFEISYQRKEIAQINWNKEWEKNFSPIIVDDRCAIRAPFHEEILVEHEIIIEPKMSFGTGHHETTYMMVQYLLELNLVGKQVLDMGCGTGVLAILANKCGATDVEAIDIDSWCYENTLENIQKNHCSSIRVEEGSAPLLQGRKYDLIIANINRNILLADLPIYAASLKREGELLLSGFYTQDLSIITQKCKDLGLKFISKKSNNSWIAAYYHYC